MNNYPLSPILTLLFMTSILPKVAVYINYFLLIDGISKINILIILVYLSDIPLTIQTYSSFIYVKK